MIKTELPKVTIVTPSYNQAEFLEATMLSVLNQTYPNIEYIVVDGGSTDGSVDIIKKYEDQLAWWVSEPDNGQSDAINKGFRHATGEIYNWLNSDDILYPEAVKIAVHFLKKYPQYEVVYGNRIIIDEKNRIFDAYEPVSLKKSIARFTIRIPQETTFFTAQLWEKVGGLNESLHFSMDADLWFRFLNETRFFHIPVYLGAYRNHIGSKSVYGLGKNVSEKARQEIAFLRREYAGFFSRNPFLRKMMRHFNVVRGAYERNKKRRRLIKEEVQSLISD